MGKDRKGRGMGPASQKFTVCLGQEKAKFIKSAQSRAYGFRASQAERRTRRVHGSQVKPHHRTFTGTDALAGNLGP